MSAKVEVKELETLILPDFEFAEWVGVNYTRVGKKWIDKRTDRTYQKKGVKTKKLYKIYLDQK